MEPEAPLLMAGPLLFNSNRPVQYLSVDGGLRLLYETAFVKYKLLCCFTLVTHDTLANRSDYARPRRASIRSAQWDDPAIREVIRLLASSTERPRDSRSSPPESDFQQLLVEWDFQVVRDYMLCHVCHLPGVKESPSARSFWPGPMWMISVSDINIMLTQRDHASCAVFIGKDGQETWQSM